MRSIANLGFCLDEAQRNDLKLPMTEKTYHAYQALSEQGEGRMDTSILIKAVNS